MSGRNVFAVARSIWGHDAFADEPFSQREAWIWLIGAAAWRDTKVRINGAPVAIKRGEFCFAVRFLAEKWRWSKSRTDRFINMLEKQAIIRDNSRDKSKIYSINKYNHFQVVGLPKRDSERDDDRDLIGTSPGLDRDKEETGKQVNSKTIEQEPPAIAVASKAIAVSRATQKPAWLDPAAWAGFVEMRRRKRAPITARAERQILEKLDRWRALGHDPTAILDKSTENSWTTIYEPKAEGSYGNRTKGPSAHDKLNQGTVLYLQSLGLGADADNGGEGQAIGDADSLSLPLLAPRLLA